MAISNPPSVNALQKTLDAQLLAGATASMTLNNTTNVVNGLGMVVIDRVDANGAPTASKREYVSFTGTSGSTLTGLTRNADGGGSDQDHAVGAIVEFVNDVVQAKAVKDSIEAEHSTAGAHTTDSIAEKTAAAGVTVDGLLIKDGALPNYNTNSLFYQALINGNFDVWQRGTSGAGANNATTFVADRWNAKSANTSTTFSRQTASLNGSYYSMRCQRDNGSSDTSTVITGQSLETVNTIPFRGKKITVSFYAKCGANFSSTDNKITVKVATGTGTDENSLGTYTGQSTAINTTQALTTSWTKYTFTSSAVIAGTVTEMGLQLYNTPTGTAGAADYFEVAQVQLCAGSVALPFQPKSYDAELKACQRYCYVPHTAYNNNDIVGWGWASTTTNGVILVRFPAVMRRESTLTVTASDWTLSDAVTDIAATAIGDDINQNSGDICRLNVTVASGLTAFRPYYLRAESANDIMVFDAEL